MSRVSLMLSSAALVLLASCAYGGMPDLPSTASPLVEGTAIRQQDLPPQWTSTPGPMPSETATVSPVARPFFAEMGTSTPVVASTADIRVSPTMPLTSSPTSTLPPEEAWETYADPLGAFQLKMPPTWDAWAVPLECGVLHFFDSGAVYNLRLLLFTRCWDADTRETVLTFDETYMRFADQFKAISRARKVYSGLQAERVRYRSVEGEFILDLQGSGTLALWRRGELGFALIDHRDRWQENMIFERVLSSFEFTQAGTP